MHQKILRKFSGFCFFLLLPRALLVQEPTLKEYWHLRGIKLPLSFKTSIQVHEAERKLSNAKSNANNLV